MFFKELSVGSFWYNLNPNSLVGFQRFVEKNLDVFFINKENLLHNFYIVLDFNIFLLVGIITIFMVNILVILLTFP